MHNTIEDPYLSFDRDQESSQSTACTAAAAPSQDGQTLELDILRLDCPDRGSQSWYRDLQCVKLPFPLDLDNLPD